MSSARGGLFLVVAVLCTFILGCASQPASSQTAAPAFLGKDPRQIAAEYAAGRGAKPFILIGTGDIAACDEPVFSRAQQTAAVIVQEPDALAFTAGDNVYTSGRIGPQTLSDLENCYGKSWGQFRDRTLPAPGNHDYGIFPIPIHPPHSLNAYFAYFGANAANQDTQGKGYYSADLAKWHFVSLNSDIINRLGDSNSDVQAQYAWLRSDLDRALAQGAKCIVAVWHHSRFANSGHKDNPAMQTLWGILQEKGADLAITGHTHAYEAHEPKNNLGQLDPKGIRQFVVGTGGIGDEVLPNKTDVPFGVLRLTLEENKYTWEFIQTGGAPVDSGQSGSTKGSGNCKPK